MAKFGKFVPDGGKPPSDPSNKALPGHSGSAITPAHSQDGHGTTSTKQPAGSPGQTAIQPANQFGTSQDPRFDAYAAIGNRVAAGLNKKGLGVLCLDATASMDYLIHGVKVTLDEIFRRVKEILKEQGGNFDIQIVIFRDYCDGPQKIIKVSPRLNDPTALAVWLSQIGAEGGGDIPEAIEFALDHVLREIPEATCICLFGDAMSHTQEEIVQQINGYKFPPATSTITARELATSFGSKGIPVHCFHLHPFGSVVEDFTAIAQTSGGQAIYLNLDEKGAVVDMAALALLASMQGVGSVEEYLARYSISNGGREFAGRLTSGQGAN